MAIPDVSWGGSPGRCLGRSSSVRNAGDAGAEQRNGDAMQGRTRISLRSVPGLITEWKAGWNKQPTNVGTAAIARPCPPPSRQTPDRLGRQITADHEPCEATTSQVLPGCRSRASQSDPTRKGDHPVPQQRRSLLLRHSVSVQYWVLRLLLLLRTQVNARPLACPLS
ncbi:hypothetical protein CCHR01_08224 [Colletotrichum chrysophilum]|uniref:Uncharacterized protein n=1 Tax=Colletotrichum chrysophilum TaxID=1836956 RepID=A0AAD9ALQ1_9PEZI|nr:hypothetical protein CCHR01_08224 [Colletotrichum chrysophilum]